VQPVLPGQVVDVAEGVVNEVVTVIGRSAHAAYAAADALVGKPVICLVEEGDSDLGSPEVPKIPVGSVGKPSDHLVRVKPTRAELMSDGEKV